MTGIYNAMTGGFLDRPNLVGNPYLRRMATRQWLNPASFQPNPIGTFGTAGSDSLQAPGYVNLDIACSKQFILHQQQRLELRFESFNALNHPNFAPPDPVLANATFGKLQKDISPRLLQFAAKVYF